MSQSLGHQKLIKHRERAMRQGVSRSGYAESLGVAPQRIARLCGGADPSTMGLAEALRLRDEVKIRVDDWFRAAQ